MSDEHSIKHLGCYGNPIVKTPNLDAMAAKGATFTSAYCSTPICVPSRASLATGKYQHQVGYWDNADPYEGSVRSWHHHIREQGHQVVSIGKLHFRSTEDDNGFSREIIPMHVKDGIGDVEGLIRENMPEFRGLRVMSEDAKAGESSYIKYDRDIAEHAQRWLQKEAVKYTDKPWVLFVSFMAPHFPLTVPKEYFDYYFAHKDLPMPKLYDPKDRVDHPFVKEYGRHCNYDRFFQSKDQVRRAVAGYYGLCTFLDAQIGKVMDVLKESEFADNTRVMYTSDHGDNLGARGLWGKSTMYEESSAVPMIISGNDIPEGITINEPVSHVDVYPFVLDCVGEDKTPLDAEAYYGVSLNKIANGYKPDRVVLSEYHAWGSSSGAFMVRLQQFKYIYYVGRPEQLFDLKNDPEELVDVSDDKAYEAIKQEARERLFKMLDPEDVDLRAKTRQKSILASFGGPKAVWGTEEMPFTPPPTTYL